MASMRDIKRRIKSVGSTQQITKAMNLVSASKLGKAKMNLAATKPFYTETYRVISNVVKNSAGINHPFLQKRDEKKVLVILLTADRGLCGGYNANINKETEKFIEGKDAQLVVVGTKGRDYFKRRGHELTKLMTGISENPDYINAREIGEFVLNKYTNNEVDAVYIAFTEFETTLSHIPTVKRLLPVDTDSINEESKETSDKQDLSLMDYEPDEEEVLSYIVPKFLNTVIYGAMVESSTCEQAARMTSMDSATENAYTMIDSLTLKYNRARQGAITQEITEIVSGANALE
ncbi:MAG: ATP synthase F1 subunit gamma [Lachnospirales bacterium]